MFFVVHLNKQKTINKTGVSCCTNSCDGVVENGKLKCDCGNDVKIFEWCWKNDNTSINFQLDANDLEVTFHPVYSTGTAVVRGNKPFQQNKHYYWEIKMISNLYGTDVMVGVGTDKTSNSKFRFCSVLGCDDQSWGYSYHGNIQHNKLIRKYGKGFGLGCIVGVHLDMCSGSLEYYLNRKPLGVAFDGLKGRELYPMVCSTAAQSAMKLNCAVSQEETLQMLCLRCVHQHPYLFKKYSSIPGLCTYYRRKYFWMVPKEDTEEPPNREKEDENLHLLTIKNSSIRKKRSPEFIWTKPSKKVTINRINSTESQPFQHFVSTSSSSTIAEEYVTDSALQNDDICQLVYECLSDSNNDGHDSDSDNSISDKIAVLVPVENDSDSSSSN